MPAGFICFGFFGGGFFFLSAMLMAERYGEGDPKALSQF